MSKTYVTSVVTVISVKSDWHVCHVCHIYHIYHVCHVWSDMSSRLCYLTCTVPYIIPYVFSIYSMSSMIVSVISVTPDMSPFCVWSVLSASYVLFVLSSCLFCLCRLSCTMYPYRMSCLPCLSISISHYVSLVSLQLTTLRLTGRLLLLSLLNICLSPSLLVSVLHLPPPRQVQYDTRGN